jgi:hypothetical protein
MRIIDIAIPKIGPPPPAVSVRPAQPTAQSQSLLPISSNAFAGVKKQEYVVDEEHNETSTISSSEYFDAEGDTTVWKSSDHLSTSDI